MRILSIASILTLFLTFSMANPEMKPYILMFSESATPQDKTGIREKVVAMGGKVVSEMEIIPAMNICMNINPINLS